MRRRKYILLLTIIIKYSAFTQSYIALNVDNDLYFGTDRYYSSGIFIEHGYKKTNDSISAFKTQHWTFGQEITTPHLRLTQQKDKIDYPYNGWLFLGFRQEVFQHPKRGYGYGFQWGTTGATASLAKPVQNAYHKIVLGLEPLSWAATQVQAFHANFFITSYKAIPIQKRLDAVFFGRGQWGTYRSTVLSRFGLQWSSFEALPFFGHRLENLQKGMAFYVGIQNEYRWHDFAVQGSLFRSNAALDIEAVPLKQEWEGGFLFQQEDWRFAVFYNNASRDIKTQKYSRHQYLNITLTKFF